MKFLLVLSSFPWPQNIYRQITNYSIFCLGNSVKYIDLVSYDVSLKARLDCCFKATSTLMLLYSCSLERALRSYVKISQVVQRLDNNHQRDCYLLTTIFILRQLKITNIFGLKKSQHKSFGFTLYTLRIP